jgi:DNA-binding beta-propeller fold protein YncE
MATPTVGTGTSPLSIGITPAGTYVYVVNDAASDHSISQYSVGSNGSLTPLSPTKVSVGSTPAAITFDPAGKNAYVVDTAGAVWQMAIGSGGALVQVGSTSVASVSGFAVEPSGRFAYASSKSGTGSQFVVGSSGGLTLMSPGTVAAGQSPFGIAVNF